MFCFHSELRSCAEFSLLVVALSCYSVKAETAEDLPAQKNKSLYEIGVGAGSGIFPHYPASDQGKWRSLIAPTFRYRGSIFRADEEDGARAKLITSTWYGVELSGTGTLPASSDENSAREGMPDLDLLGEVGPQLYFILQKENTFQTRLFLSLRAAATTDFSSLRHRGFTFVPGLELRSILPKPYGAIKLELSALFAAKDYQEYYYDVPAEYATADRPEYYSSEGYMGYKTDFVYSIEWDRLGLFVLVEYHNFASARNSESPLFRAEHQLSGVFGMSWVMFKSETKEEERF